MVCQENFANIDDIYHKFDLDLGKKVVSQKKLIIFDFDGSFCDSEPIHFAAYRDAFSLFGHIVKETEYYERFTQNPDGISLECQAYGLSLNKAEVFALKKKFYRERIENGEAKPFKEMSSILTNLRQLKIPWSIASNSSKVDIECVLSNLAATFQETQAVIGPSEMHLKKPNPDLFIEALRQGGVRAEEALIIEDTDKGLQAAAAAGIDAICLATRYNKGLPMTVPYVLRCTHKELNLILERLNSDQKRP